MARFRGLPGDGTEQQGWKRLLRPRWIALVLALLAALALGIRYATRPVETQEVLLLTGQSY
jgi:hypothetical protein